MGWDALQPRQDQQWQALRRLLSQRPKRGAKHSRNARLVAIARAALKLVAGASITTSALLLLQLAWVGLRTPRLPPPPLSGADFVREGRVVDVSGDCGGDDEECARDGSDRTEAADVALNQTANTTREEFRLVLVGDSPVEGIGHSCHDDALGGQTAHAFAKLVRRRGRDRVRYWAYGKSGLTARGIKEEMIPFLHRVADNDGGSDSAVHAVILLCGVNNVLDPLSTTESFYSEVKSLLRSIRIYPGLEEVPLVVLGLPDFAKLPFLPWPLSFALGVRARKMQKMLERVVRECQEKEREGGRIAKTVMVNIPEVQDILGSIGYHRYESCSEQNGSNSPGPLKMRLVHPLNHLSLSSRDQTKLGSLGVADFLCGDGFHPGGYGTEYIGSLLAEAYGKMIANSADKSQSNTA